ncbi:MAG TPA: glycoside hydrolase family 43 protein [Pricia sp.]|nr:glycoside hydrolase family 43 protein [Pricia sp.]
MYVKNFHKLLTGAFALVFFVQVGIAQDKDTFTNPILEDGADPYAVLHDDGYYYFMATRGNRLDLWRTDDLTQLESVTPKTIWSPQETGPNSCCIWAPEIHYIDGKWYVYYTGSDKSDEGDHSRFVFVLENSSANPMEGEWIDRGQINTKYSGIDGSIFPYRGKMYFLYSPYVGDHSDVAIATMENPWTLNNDESILAAPKYDWEKTDDRSILEGPMFLEGPKDEVFIVYSAGACWDDNYSLGLLAAKKDADFLEAGSWQRFPEAVFEMSKENDVYGPGHHGFTISRDGMENWLIFHAKDRPGLGCSQRSSRLQRFTWRENGRPDFGVPWPLEKEIEKP